MNKKYYNPYGGWRHIVFSIDDLIHKYNMNDPISRGFCNWWEKQLQKESISVYDK